MEIGMELPGILKELFIGPGRGMIELCPDEYDMGRIGELLADALEECEELALASGARTSGDKPA